MLPVLIYEPDDALRTALLEELKSFDSPDKVRMRIELATDSKDSMCHAIQSEDGILLSILGVHPGQSRTCGELSEMIQRKNRNSYTLFCLHDASDLDDLLENCLRLAGILTVPLPLERLRRTLDRIVIDYLSLTEEKTSTDSIFIESGSSSYYIPCDQILYLEALNKLLTIHTVRQNITVRRALSSLENTLPKQFVRCHRAYIINTRYIDQVNLRDMCVTVTNGDILPISRSQRAILKPDAQEVLS